MEIDLMLKISQSLEKGEKVALATVTKIDGSVPGKIGSMLALFENGMRMGTVGGGNLEHRVTEECRNALVHGKSQELEFPLVDHASLHMKCGGNVKIFIKVFKRRESLLIVGGGHIGLELYKLARFMDMDVEIYDDREEFCNMERFPEAKNLFCGDIEENLGKSQNLKGNFVAIATRGHLGDKDALRAVADRECEYVGMIGSTKKVIETFTALLEEGVSRENLEKIYSPMGLDIADGTPKEIALGIMAEILMVKNRLTGKPMSEIKKIKF